MTKRTRAIEILSVYFEKEGRILSAGEYRTRTDAPIRLARVKSIFGSWARMENIMRTFNGRNFRPEDYVPSTNYEEVAAKIAEEANRLWEAKVEAGEDVEVKTLRERAAEIQREHDALAAATPEGANAVKERKGGFTDQDAKAATEAVNKAVAELHAQLAATPEGANLGKKLLGGVEDQDEKTKRIAEQLAETEKNALLATTPEGADKAKLTENDVDGKLTREAQNRIEGELRPYTPPVTEKTLADAVTEAKQVVTPEAKKAIDEAAALTKGTDQPSDTKAEAAIAKVDTEVKNAKPAETAAKK